MLWQHGDVLDWPGRARVESLRQWPDLVQTVARLKARPDLFLGMGLLGSLSRGEGDAISDIDLLAVTQPSRWQAAWDARQLLSSGALVTFDRFEHGRPEVAGHSWIAPSLVKVECLITAPGRMRIRGNVVVVIGRDDLLEAFERVAPFSRAEVDDYAARLHEAGALTDVERAYANLIGLLKREIRPSSDPTHLPRGDIP